MPAARSPSVRFAALAAALALGAVGGCKREERQFEQVAPSSNVENGLRLTDLQPGEPIPTPPVKNMYDGNAYAISEGKNLFSAFNCVGCHGHGGGGMGPPLMDNKWIYGSEPQQIYATIMEGRPNGMPSFRGKVPDDQVWKLVAYVRSLSGQVSANAASGREDHMRTKPPESSMPDQRPTKSPGIPHSGEMPR
jgi:cytochrome c oxidase cbb3-type subunit 3